MGDRDDCNWSECDESRPGFDGGVLDSTRLWIGLRHGDAFGDFGSGEMLGFRGGLQNTNLMCG